MCSVLAPGGNNHRAFFVVRVEGWEGVARLTHEEPGWVAGQPDQCPLAKVCHRETLPGPTLQRHVGTKVSPGCILVVTKGMYGGVAMVPPELEGVAQVVEWRQV